MIHMLKNFQKATENSSDHKKEMPYRRRSPNQNASFLQYISDKGIDFEFEESSSTQENFDSFYSTAITLLDKFYPMKIIRISNRDPHFVNPHIKTQLRRKNALMRKGRIEEAGTLSLQIGKMIAKQGSTRYLGIDKTNISGTKDLWSAVRRLTKDKIQTSNPSGFSASDLNKHYCFISTDRAYIEPNVKYSCQENIQTFKEMEIFNCLDNLKFTASGLDGLPAWFLRLAAPIFAEPITNLVNKSVCTSTVPEQWKRALINPIPKAKNPEELGDYRPISITPVLSRITEKMVVRKYIYPAMLDPPPSLSFADQFAFRPTGSTTAALITLMRTVTTLLETNPYVIVYVLDFSKAFDTVRHSTLLEKMALLNLPDQIYNWFVNYYSGHSHCTSFCGAVSELADITASIIQGSGGGPASYAVNASDLKTVHSGNELVKFADDTDLVVPASNAHTSIEELDNIKAWAERNTLKLNESKSVEIVFRNPRSKTSPQINPPPTPMSIIRKKEIKTLGVTISDTFSIKENKEEKEWRLCRLQSRVNFVV